MTISRQERNLEDVTRELISLQKISSAMISTSYLDDVLQIIVEGIEKGLQYDAGILFVLDDVTKTLFPHIMHRNEFVQTVEKKIGVNFGSVSISRADKQNLLSQAVQRRKILISDHLQEVFYGASVQVPADMGDEIMQKTRVRKFVAVPMIIRDEVAGVILCATARAVITKPEMESLKNFANQAGLAVDNAQIMNSLKRTQSELSQQNARLNQAYNDLRELEMLKNGLIGMVVHDMKNPLTSVRGYLELILEGGESSEKVDLLVNYVKKAYEGSEDLLKMIHNLLDISRMEEGKFTLNLTRCLLGDVISNVYEQLKVVANANQRDMVLDVDPGMEPVMIDFDILQRVISNLVSNAIKHTRKNGRIVIHARTDPKDRSVTVCVEDDGEGIPTEHLESIFEKFSQVKGKGYRNTHNVGLGLTFCKMAVEKHQGKIWVESEVEKGSRFKFWLPDGK